jgi:hypothetical protein
MNIVLRDQSDNCIEIGIGGRGEFISIPSPFLGEEAVDDEGNHYHLMLNPGQTFDFHGFQTTYLGSGQFDLSTLQQYRESLLHKMEQASQERQLLANESQQKHNQLLKLLISNLAT